MVDTAEIKRVYQQFSTRLDKEVTMYEIHYLGHIFKTSQYLEMSDEQYEEVCREIYKTPTIEEVRKELVEFNNGSVLIPRKVFAYYVRDLMFDTRYYKALLTVNEMLASKTICGIYNGKIRVKELFFDRKELFQNFLQVMDVGAGHVCKKVSNFKVNFAEKILTDKEFFPFLGSRKLNWYDYSCGWAARLLAALKQNVNYYGTDPNDALYPKLLEIAKEFNECNCPRSPRMTDIRCQGSETFVDEWEGKMDLCFSSPPYFFMENYQHGNQSWKEGMTYEQWLDSFMRPTIENCNRYLTDDGYYMVNVKNFGKFHLYDDTRKIAEDVGFIFIKELKFKNEQRYKYVNGEPVYIDTDENVAVFRKTPPRETTRNKFLSDL